MENKESPFTILKKWFLNDEKEPPEIVKTLNMKSILSLFAGNRKVTPYLDKYFNNYELYKLDITEFCKFLKFDIVKTTNMTWNDFTFLKTELSNKTIKEVQKLFPYFKDYEIFYLLNKIEKDPNYEGIMEYLGLLDHKIKKITKKELKEFNEVNDNINSSNIITFDIWCQNFNN